MIAVIDVGVGDHVIVALGVVADLIVVVVIVVDVVADVGNDGEDVHGRGQEGHLSDGHCGTICGRRTSYGLSWSER